MPVITQPTQPPQPPKLKDSCLLLGYLSIIIQCFLGLIILSALIVKRLREHPKRKMQIFVYDIVKQLSGAIGIHFINLLLSILLSNSDPEVSISTCKKIKKITIVKKILISFISVYSNKDGNGGNDGDDKTQCSWYFLNLLSDCTFGVYIFYYIINKVNSIFKNSFNFKNIESGNYWELKVEKRLATSSQFKNMDDKSIVSINGKIVKDHAILQAIPDKHKNGYSIRINGPKFKILLVQTMIFFISLIIMKLIISILLEIDIIGNVLFHITDEILGFMSKLFRSADIFFVMFVAPLCLNIFQYVCIDSIIKLKPKLKKLITTENEEQVETDINDEYRFLIDKLSYENFEENVPLLA
ncbi:hypothetical protein HANVADRAFT_58278 [Hanseniaspora valbyensis NRRL Y-1626]|uniref:Vacuolar membrane protein n=1 Tax=Hanseniaspora valbyensis NRRL Y-1626 TaxID=766949 RepID=A0A1B7TGZ8_9ASCO|nr:hypothetical protein HANVADRAFT_58278 [Hanseniaspora valbyensis NRRL Y-1626]